MNYLYVLSAIAVMSLVTIFTRAFPFVVFGNSKKPAQWVVYLGEVLPPAIIAMLIVYCLKSVSVITYPFGLPELIACVLVVVLHIWKRNNMLSIFGGTIIYMILVQFVFV